MPLGDLLFGGYVGTWPAAVYPGAGAPYPHGAKAADRLDATPAPVFPSGWITAALAHPQDVQRPRWWDDSEMRAPWGYNYDGSPVTEDEAMIRGWLDDEPAEPEDPTDYELADYLNRTALSVAELVETKQQDYGPAAINLAPGGSLNGIHVRLHDKLERAINLERAATPNAPNHEPLRDTYVDIAGYALIALALLDGAWPE